MWDEFTDRIRGSDDNVEEWREEIRGKWRENDRGSCGIKIDDYIYVNGVKIEGAKERGSAPSTPREY